MPASQPSTQRGQALVLIALAAVGLFAFAALAIDGGAVFSDRRHSQNASDTAAYAAALARVRSSPNWKQVGQERAKVNGYDPIDGVTEVKVYSCLEWKTSADNPSGEDCKGLPTTLTNAIRDEYVYVRIKSVVDLMFAPVIGWREVTNYTDAVVRATPAKVVPWYDGNALVSTMQTCKHEAGWSHDPFTVTGNSGTTVIYSGILVNSECSDAYDQGGSSKVTTSKGVCVVGSAESTNTNPPPTEGCKPIDPNKYATLPNPTCSQQGGIQEISSKNYLARPGNYDDPFPSQSDSGPLQAGTLKLQPGVYCLKEGISFNSTWNITTDLDGDGHDSGEGVFFYVPGGDVTFNGNSTIKIHAVSAPLPGFDSTYINYLIYVPPTNQNTIKITGSDGSSFTGTVLAPASHIALSGGSTTSGGVDDGHVIIDAQIIGFSMAIEGNGTLNIIYNQSNNGVTTEKPNLSTTE